MSVNGSDRHVMDRVAQMVHEGRTRLRIREMTEHLLADAKWGSCRPGRIVRKRANSLEPQNCTPTRKMTELRLHLEEQLQLHPTRECDQYVAWAERQMTEGGGA